MEHEAGRWPERWPGSRHIEKSETRLPSQCIDTRSPPVHREHGGLYVCLFFSLFDGPVTLDDAHSLAKTPSQCLQLDIDQPMSFTSWPKKKVSILILPLEQLREAHLPASQGRTQDPATCQPPMRSFTACRFQSDNKSLATPFLDLTSTLSPSRRLLQVSSPA